ncbi:hypothetical protein TNCT_145511 [Trichonephila clavata]|uniref:Mos1 transposase HTH domain-containing protein n=1 Tax=Trichonephila clavata TaxID=2740835 RepID=A0A8X6G974_TRICU|nr:hypothetical protein TNCT_145511 [Trichonephila clavata]
MLGYLCLLRSPSEQPPWPGANPALPSALSNTCSAPHYPNPTPGHHNSSRNISATFRDISVSERTIRRWYAKFESGDEGLTNEDRKKPEIVLNNAVLRVLVEQNPGSTV